MKQFHMINYLLCGICPLWITGCSNMLDEMQPKDRIPQDALSESDLIKLFNRVYAEMEGLVSRFYTNGGVKGENFKASPGFSMNDPMLMAPNSKDVLEQWQKRFTALEQVSFLVETYEASPNKDSQVARQTGRTGYYSRALIYYHLVTRWGGAPILRKRTYDVVPIPPKADVWNFIKEDLGKTEGLLLEFTGRFYVSLSVCDTLNTKVCLALKDYTNVTIYADRVIAKSNFALNTISVEYANAFISNSNSKELIFILTDKRSTGLLLFYQSVNGIDPTWDYSPSADCHSHLYADISIKKQDIRAKVVFGADNSRIIKFPNGSTGQFVTNEQPSQAPMVVAHATEVYLIKVEALGVTNGLPTLKEFVNKRYATISLPSSTNGAELQNQILDGRHHELCAEGRRWYDLKRTSQLGLFISLNGRDYLICYPVPQSERDLAGVGSYPQNDDYQ